jgi:hypothetical protein
MTNEDVSKEFPDRKQRIAVCLTKAIDGLEPMAAADLKYNVEELGFTEELTEDNFYIPAEAEYVELDGDDQEDWDIEAAESSLWENIRRKKERMGKNYRPAKTEKEGRPTQDQLRRAQSLLQEALADEYGEGDMQREQLMKMHKQLMEIEKYLEDVDFQEWTKDMISKAEIYIQNVYDFVAARNNESYGEHYDQAEALEAEALQRGKPGPNDPRKTPAPKKDQKRGSKKNKPGSAKNPSGKITFSKETTSKLSKIVREHNAKGKGSKATLGMLKAVYRRGAGAFSTSHAPKMSRDGWAMARVRAFIHLLRTGKPSNPNYKQDNDLLPKGHPRKSKAMIAYSAYKYENPKTGEVFTYVRQGNYKKDGVNLIYKGKAAKYKGRTVKLNKPFRTPDGPKKFAVYTKNDKDKVVIVRFGDPNMEIKRDNPARRKSFRARHKCDTNPGPKYKARYWSCRMW